jgi:chloride channel 7
MIGVGLAFYFLTLITFGTAMPSGIFTPVVLSGASLGGAMGNAFHMYIDKDISPSTFALLGVAAMLAGIQRSTVSAAVILVEGTGSMEILVPVIVVVVVAKGVAQSVNKLGVFEEVIGYKNYPYLPHEHLKRYYDGVQVKDIMSEPPLVTVSPKERVGDLEELLQTSAHHGFPVVETGTRKFLGLVKRNQIILFLRLEYFQGALLVTARKT